VIKRSERIIFRVLPQELALIKKAAARDERLLSDFVRLTLLRAIRGTGKRKART